MLYIAAKTEWHGDGDGGLNLGTWGCVRKASVKLYYKQRGLAGQGVVERPIKNLNDVTCPCLGSNIPSCYMRPPCQDTKARGESLSRLGPLRAFDMHVHSLVPRGPEVNATRHPASLPMHMHNLGGHFAIDPSMQILAQKLSQGSVLSPLHNPTHVVRHVATRLEAQLLARPNTLHAYACGNGRPCDHNYALQFNQPA